MTRFKTPNPEFEAETRASFDRQGAMHFLGARLGVVEPGRVTIELPYRDELSQQHGFFHGGITATIADSAGGYAAFTLFPAGSAILTVEFKINLVAPGDGELLIASGRVKKPGRTLTVCDLEVSVVKGGKVKPCAYGMQTLMCLEPRGDLPAG
jgi:uncharacterized protein (TIGR00369 family)